MTNSTDHMILPWTCITFLPTIQTWWPQTVHIWTHGVVGTMQSHGNCIMGSYHDSLNQIQINQVFLQFRLSWSLCNRSNISLGGCDYKFVQNEDIQPLHQLKLICNVLLIYSVYWNYMNHFVRVKALCYLKLVCYISFRWVSSLRATSW